MKLVDESVTHEIIGGFFAVHNKLRFGFLEQIYKDALQLELRGRRLTVQRETLVRVYYGDTPIGRYRTDFVVENRVVLEIKSTAKIANEHHRQLHNYLRATDLEIGFLLHFGPAAKFYRFYVPNTPASSQALSGSSPAFWSFRHA